MRSRPPAYLAYSSTPCAALRVLFITLFVVIMGLLIVDWFLVPSDQGVVQSYPVFRERDEYYLNSHGTLTEVPRNTYLLSGTFGEVYVALFISLFALLALHYAVCGRHPWFFEQQMGGSKGVGE